MLKKPKLCLILSLSLFSCSNNKKIIFLGEKFLSFNDDILELLNQELEMIVDSQFSSSSFTMKNLYSNLEKDALNIVTSKSLISTLKHADEVLLNVGNYELLRFIDIDSNQFIYNEEIIKTNLEMFDYYLHNALDLMTNYVDDIYVIPLFNCLVLEEQNEFLLNELIYRYNEKILQNCDEFNVKYIEINALSKFVYKDYYLTEAGVNYLIGEIKKIHGK